MAKPKVNNIDLYESIKIYQEKEDFTLLCTQLDKIIDGVCYTLKVFPNNLIYDDLRQELYIKSLKIVRNYNTEYVSSVKDYLFMALRNTALDVLVKQNKYRDFKYTYSTQLKVNNLYEY